MSTERAAGGDAGELEPLVQAYLDGMITEEQAADLRRLLKSEERHLDVFVRAVDLHAALSAFRVRRAERADGPRRLLRHGRPTRRVSSLWASGLVAAGLLLTAALAFTLYPSRMDSGKKEGAQRPAEADRVADESLRQEEKRARERLAEIEREKRKLAEPQPDMEAHEAERRREALARLEEERRRIEEERRARHEARPEPPKLPSETKPEETRAALARVERPEGEILVLTGDEKRPAGAGQELLAGQGLLTVGARSRVVIAYPDGTTLQAEGDTAIRGISEGGEKTGIGKRIDLLRGVLSAQVVRQPAGRPMVVATPHGEARVLGTSLKVVVQPGWTRLEVTEGKVRLTRSQNGKALDVASGQYAVAAAGAELIARPLFVAGALRGILQGHAAAVLCVAFSPDGRTLASGGIDGDPRLWDARTGETRKVLVGHWGKVIDLTFSPNGKTLASAFSIRRVQVWDAGTGAERAGLSGHQEQVSGVAFSPDGAMLASASRDRTVKLWDTRMWKELATLSGHEQEVTSVAFSPDGKSLVSGGRDQTVRLWDVATRQPRQVLQAGGLVRAVASSSSGRMIAVASGTVVKVWDAGADQERLALGGQGPQVECIAISPDGSILAAGSDRCVKLWDAAAGLELGTLEGHTGKVTGVAFSPDGRALATGSEDQTVRLWELKKAKRP